MALAEQGRLLQLWSDMTPEDEVADDREPIGHIRLFFRSVGIPFAQPPNWDNTTLAKHHRQLLELGGCLKIAPISRDDSQGETGSIVTLTLISRNHLRDKLPPTIEERKRS